MIGLLQEKLCEGLQCVKRRLTGSPVGPSGPGKPPKPFGPWIPFIPCGPIGPRSPFSPCTTDTQQSVTYKYSQVRSVSEPL